ncbi:MAG: ATP-binding protein [Thermodesulfobacteriota bacterium]|nr:ATP-binding protein [Thermodesulfobacteriota bacterium]
MLELALHVLDIAENSTRAGAILVQIQIVEDVKGDILSLEIKDDGIGMDSQGIEGAMDPFFTTKKVRRIGLGLPMLSQASHAAGGAFSIESQPGKGTMIRASFQYSHIDRQPLGDMPGVIAMLILGNPDIDFCYTHHKNAQEYTLDTREIREELDGIPINHMEVISLIRDNIRQGLLDMDRD